MAVQIISRPIGHKLSTTQVSGTVYDNGAGDAVVYVAGGHSLSDGDYVYIESNIEAYAGYKYVDSTSYDYFKIKNSAEGTYVPYYQDSAVTMYVSILNHGWQSVHLPIVYELNSDLWPINVAEEEYNPNTVDSFESFGGNTQLNLDKALSDPTALTYIELVGDGPLAGAYQITSVLQPWSVVINLAYDATNDFTGYTVVKYYNNYHINIEVWAGLEPDHRWVALKPFELAATIKLIPDSSGNVRFSIHEILRGYIHTRNNLTLETLPNNIDFHTAFYIKVYESYDTSDGVQVTVENGDETDDSANFIGHAVNSMMPFKSLNSGFMSDYVGGGDYLARWLTLFDVPTAIIGYFFDLSFINTLNGFDINVNIEKSTGGITTETEVLSITNPGSGVIRVPFTPESGFDMYCIQAFLGSGGDALSLSEFQNEDDGGAAWSLGATPSVSAVAGVPTDILYKAFSPVAGIQYTITFNFTISGGAVTGAAIVRTYDSSFNTIDNDVTNVLTGGTYNGSITFTASEDIAYIGFVGSMVSATRTVTINSASYTSLPYAITEQICINVVDECDTTFTNDDLRLTETGPFRELE